MESIWTKTVNMKQHPQLQDDLERDIVIIGGGMTGILMAYFLKRKGIGAVVLEANRIGMGQTKNTTAKITSQHGLIYKKLADTFGKEQAAQYARLNQSAIEDYQRIIKEENIQCGFMRLPSYLYSFRDTKLLQQESWAAEAAGIPIRFTKETELPFPVAGALAFENQAQFHPLEFISHLSKDLEIYEKTNVIKVEGDRAITKDHQVRGKNIIFATHYPFVNFPGYFFMKLHQQRSYVIALENAMELEGMYYSADKKNQWSLRSHDGLLLLGGAGHRTGVVPKKDPYEVLRRKGQQLWPEAEEQAFWSAQDCITFDGVPYIGRFSASKPDWYVATGYGKWGMTGSMVAARVLADQIMGMADSKDTIFHPARLKFLASFPSICREGVSTAKQFLRALTGVAPRCSHLGCALDWNPYEKTWECSCHGSRFQEDGTLIDNPAQEDVFYV